MNTEILSHQASTPESPINLLFIHGVCLSAWVWQENFLPYFAQRGYTARAVSLRGHGNSPDNSLVRRYSFREYTEDLQKVLESIDGPTVVVGHSFGGALLQNMLRKGTKMAGAVLMAPVPPHGVGYSSWLMFYNSPSFWRELARVIVYGPDKVDYGTLKKEMFSEDLADEDFQRFLEKKIEDFPLAASKALMGWPPFAPPPLMLGSGLPIMIMGAENDTFVPKSDVHITAAYYGTKSYMIPDMAHIMMLDTRWEDAAKCLLTWLKEQFPDQNPD